jgi:serine O-acetyltransferase
MLSSFTRPLAEARPAAAPNGPALDGAVPPEGDLWGLAGVVYALRRPRPPELTRTGERGRGALPSREALERVVAGLRAALYPAHFGPPELTERGLDDFVGQTLRVSLRILQEEIARALCHAEALEGGALADPTPQAVQLTRALAARLPRIRALLDADIRESYEGDPAARSVDEPLFCCPGVSALLHHRVAHELYELGLPLLARIVAEIAHGATGIDIHPGAQIGEGLFIDHGTGVVIGETSVIGRHVRLYQGVTLGAEGHAVDERGNPLRGFARHPVVEDEVIIHAGATILGRVTIGRGSVIGGNVWLTRSVPPGSRITQAAVRAEVFGDGGGI